MISRNPALDDIWLAYIVFSDHPSAGKVRPVVVVDVNIDTATVIVMKVTSKDLSKYPTIPRIPLYDWNRYGLVKPSCIRLDQTFELAFEDLLRDEPLGRLPKSCTDVLISLLTSS